MARNESSLPIDKVKLADHITLYKVGRTGVYSNMIAVNTRKGVVVFDALQFPDVSRRVRSMIEEEFGKNIAYLINTHGTVGHTGGNEVFSDVPIIACQEVHKAVSRMKETFKRLRSAQGNPAAGSGAPRMPQTPAKQDYPGDPREIDEQKEVDARMAAFLKSAAVLVPPTIMFNDQMTLDMGDMTLRMFANTPSYSASDIIIHIPEDNALIVGDVFNKNRLPWLSPRTDFAAMKSLFSPFLAEDSKVRIIVGTHGYAMTVDEVRENFRYIDTLRQEAARLHNEGKTLDEAKKELALKSFPVFGRFNPFFYGTSMDMHDNNIRAVWRQLEAAKK